MEHITSLVSSSLFITSGWGEVFGDKSPALVFFITGSKRCTVRLPSGKEAGVHCYSVKINVSPCLSYSPLPWRLQERRTGKRKTHSVAIRAGAGTGRELNCPLNSHSESSPIPLLHRTNAVANTPSSTSVLLHLALDQRKHQYWRTGATAPVSSASHAPVEHQWHLVGAGPPWGHSRVVPGHNWAAQWMATGL